MRLALLLTATLAIPATALGQVTVQQPVVSRFGVTTSVSVPDRGTVLLGGVSRYAASRSRYGFGPWARSSVGREVSSSNVTATVRIHDLRAMDAYLLSLESGGPDISAPALTARAELRGHRGLSARRHAEPATGVPPSIAERAFARGQRAELEGRTGVARLHYEMAARHGSTAARTRLTSLTASR